jgi:hypothetical protein
LEESTVSRPVPTLFAVCLLGAGFSGCGAASEGARSSSQTLPPKALESRAGATTPASSAARPADDVRRDSDGDEDNKSGTRYDSDDDPYLRMGRRADAADARAIEGLVERYYAAAAAADGAKACKLLSALIAESIVEQYASSDLRGTSCAAVMSNIFERNRGQLTGGAAAPHVIRVRVEGERGLAMMSFGSGREGYLLLRREGGVWRVNMALDAELP